MDDPLWINDLLGGSLRGLGPSAMRALLRVAAGGYAGVVALRDWYYSKVPWSVRRVDVPVISIGNITVGGTGKTPVTMMLAEMLHALGRRVAIVSRGYRSRPGVANDEAQEIREQLPYITHIQQPDRVAAAEMAIRRFLADTILLDDGFQHRRLHRELDIVLLDALCPFGHGYTLPRGLLRESPSALRRAHIVMLTRADLVDETQRRHIWHQVERYGGTMPRIEVAMVPRKLAAYPILEELDRYRRIAAFCGIGNPNGFLRTLQGCRFRVDAFRTFPDHFSYDSKTLKELACWVSSMPAIEAVVCTRKDWVKIRRSHLGAVPLRALSIEPVLLTGGDHLLGFLRQAVDSRLA